VLEISPRWRKVLRDLWLHKARTVLVVLAIALGITGAGSVLTTWAIVREVVDVGYRASNPASATIRVDSVGTGDVERLKAIPSIADVQAGRTISARARVQGTFVPVRLFVRQDFVDSPIGKLRAESGAWPPGDGAIVIERSSLDIAGSGIGESLWVAEGEGQPIPLAVTGIARDVGLAPGWMEHVVYAFVNSQTMERLGAGSRLNEVLFTTRDSTLSQDAIRRIAFEAKAALEANGRAVRDIEVPVPRTHIHADQMNSLLYTQAGFGVLALILSALLALNLVEAMLAGQVREIGVMKAVGARPSQVATMYFAIAGFLGAIAAAIAIPASSAIGRQYANLTAGMLNFDAGGAAVPGWVVFVQVAVGIVLPMLAASLPVVRGSRLPVSAALRDYGVTASDAGSSLLAAIGGLTRPLLLSLRNAFRRRARMARTLLTLSMGGAVFLGALNLKKSIRLAMDASFDAMNYDMTLGVAPSRAVPELEAAIASVPGVRTAQAWGSGSAVVVRDDGTWGNSFGLSAVPPVSAFFSPSLSAGRWLGEGLSREIVVSARLQDSELALAVGATVTLRIGDTTSTWTVVGMIPATLGSAWISRDALMAVTGDSMVSRAVVAFADTAAAAQSETRRLVNERLMSSGLRVNSSMVDDSRAAIEDHLLMVADFLSVMGWVMLIVGGLGLASTMSLAVMERTREIGVLRAIGARHGAIHAIVQIEGLVIAVTSWLLAIPLSAPMGAVLGGAFGRIFFRTPVPIVPQLAGVITWLGVVVLVSAVACAWPAIRATRISARTALAYE